MWKCCNCFPMFFTEFQQLDTFNTITLLNMSVIVLYGAYRVMWRSFNLFKPLFDITVVLLKTKISAAVIQCVWIWHFRVLTMKDNFNTISINIVIMSLPCDLHFAAFCSPTTSQRCFPWAWSDMEWPQAPEM